MAMTVDATEVWVSPKLVAVDDMLGGDNVNDEKGVTAELGSTRCFPSEFPYEFDFFSESSALASPGESVQDSTETESSEEEDFLAGLTRRLSQSSIRETRKLSAPNYAYERTEKSRGLAHSPQSTLSRMGSWSARSAVYNNISPNSSSQLPSRPLNVKTDSWDIVYAEVGSFKITREKPHKYDYRSREAISASQAVTPVFAAKNPNNVVYSVQTSGQTLHQPIQIMDLNKQVRENHILKQQCSSVWGRQAQKSWLAQPQQQQILNKGQSVGYRGDYCVRPHQAAWAQNQPLHNSRSAIGGIARSGYVAKRECAGTGVFLPRHYGNNAEPEPRKRTSCSPVILPNWFVRTPDNVAVQPAGFHTDHDTITARRSAVLLQQRRRWRQDGTGNQEVPLPQEWTY